MGFLDLPGLQYFYNKYIKGLKSHAFRDPANNLTTTASGYALDARQGKALDDKVAQLNSALEGNFNANEAAFTVSTYFPETRLYRSGQNVYLRCAGQIKQAVTEGTEYTISTNIPEKYRPALETIFMQSAIIDGTIIRVKISNDGKITFTPSRDMISGLGINLNLTYMTGKSNF